MSRWLGINRWPHNANTNNNTSNSNKYNNLDNHKPPPPTTPTTPTTPNTTTHIATLNYQSERRAAKDDIEQERHYYQVNGEPLHN
jgi:hypothetical protein